MAHPSIAKLADNLESLLLKTDDLATCSEGITTPIGSTLIAGKSGGVESINKAVCHRADGKLGGTYRAKMTKSHLKRRTYGRRWEIESFFSGLKRTTGSALLARTETNLLHEAALRVLAYALNRR